MKQKHKRNILYTYLLLFGRLVLGCIQSNFRLASSFSSHFIKSRNNNSLCKLTARGSILLNGGNSAPFSLSLATSSFSNGKEESLQSSFSSFESRLLFMFTKLIFERLEMILGSLGMNLRKKLLKAQITSVIIVLSTVLLVC